MLLKKLIYQVYQAVQIEMLQVEKLVIKTKETNTVQVVKGEENEKTVQVVKEKNTKKVALQMVVKKFNRIFGVIHLCTFKTPII